VTVISDRAGLVMNPDAKVKMNGAQVGKVASIEPMSNGGRTAPRLDPSLVGIIPANVGAEIASSTVFGAKFVDLVPPANPSAQPVRANQVIEGNRVTVEINTVFQQLVSVLSRSTREAQPDPRRHRQGLQRQGQEVRSVAGGPRCRAHHAQSQPGHPQPRDRHQRQRCSTPTRVSRRTCQDGGQRNEDQRHHRRPE
jgi:hypothetical protein